VSEAETTQRRLRSVLVTGASGFIGRRLCAALREEGARVRALARRPCAGPWDERVTVDLAAGAVPSSALAGVDTVFHLAGRVHASAGDADDAERHRRANVEGTRALLAAAVAAGAPGIVHFSSVKAMGEGGPACLDEDAPAAPQTDYGRSKREAERLVLEAGARQGLHAVVLRLPLVYGPGARGNLAEMLEAVARGRFPPIADPGNRRSLVHVDDVVAAALLAARRPEATGRVYLVTDGRAYSTRDILEGMWQALGRRAPRWSLPLPLLRALARAGDVAGRVRGRPWRFDSRACRKLTGSAWYSSERIARELGFRPRRDLAAGLAEMARLLE